MSTDEPLDQKAITALVASFGGDMPEVTASGLRREDVRAFLVPRITDLLDRSPAMLMSILYRVDVAEPRVKAAFALAPPAALPTVLADLLIDRQLEKLAMRRHYRDASYGSPDADG